MWTYRLTVIGSLLSSFLVGLHLPALHDMIEHGAAPRWDVLTVTLVIPIRIFLGCTAPALRLCRHLALPHARHVRP